MNRSRKTLVPWILALFAFCAIAFLLSVDHETHELKRRLELAEAKTADQQAREHAWWRILRMRDWIIRLEREAKRDASKANAK